MTLKRLFYVCMIGLVPACNDGDQSVNVQKIESMAQTIGGAAAAGRPGDYLLENSELRAIVHGRHNKRSTFPLSNGSLVDLDIQRPLHQDGSGRGKDLFYELGPMVNFKVSNSLKVVHGDCDKFGVAPCPKTRQGSAIVGCKRISTEGQAESILGVLDLLDLIIERKYEQKNLRIINDYDLCPGESFVRITTTARFSGPGTPLPMTPLQGPGNLATALLGEFANIDCRWQNCPAQSPNCDDILAKYPLGESTTEMKRCRNVDNKLAGVLGGDFAFFSGKVHIFVPGDGFDHESYTRSIFDTGGDIFSNPLSLSYISAIGEGVSYLYFADGDVSVPIFSDAFSAAMTHQTACPRNDPNCLSGKQLQFSRYVAVGHGDVASALKGYYQQRGFATGRVEGHVIDANTQSPLSDMDVFVFSRPAAWNGQDLKRYSYKDLVDAHRRASRSNKIPLGRAGLISHFRTDIGLDAVHDGSFSGQLSVGDYVLVAASDHNGTSALFPLTIKSDETAQITLSAASSAKLKFSIKDTAGQSLPSKLTIGHCFPECGSNADCHGNTPECHPTLALCTPKGGYRNAGDCRPDQSWSAASNTCVCGDTGKLPIELGGGRFMDGTVKTEHSVSGQGIVELPPGNYQVIASRGMEYDISRQFVTLDANAPGHYTASLAHVVDTTGWISADFHVHGPNSVDSGLSIDERVATYATEGVELLSSSDHDYLTDYAPTVFKLGLTSWVKTQVGAEISPIDYGHFIGFPLRFDETAELNGAFHWRINPDKCPVDGNHDWCNMVPFQIRENLKRIGLYSPEQTITFVAHYYDYFTYFNVDPWTLELPAFSITRVTNKILNANNFTGDFDAFELFNGKNLDLLRRPTWKEVKQYNTQLNALLANTTQSPEQRQQMWLKISADAQRTFLQRDASEQQLAINYDSANFQCRCTTNAECGDGSICDPARGSCINSCQTDEQCNETWVAQSREACLVTPDQNGIKTCQRIRPTCQIDEDCTAAETGRANERCLPDTANPGNSDKRCEIPCTTDKDCGGDDKRPICNVAQSRCVALASANDLAPCPALRGTIDDWFQMLNRGIRRPALGNSDSHGTYGTEAGIPRNYISSTASRAAEIQSDEVVDRIKKHSSFMTYGPFVTFEIDDKPLGSTIVTKPGQAVKLHIRVQSPLWFDVDRIEIYRNGQMIKEINGSPSCRAGAVDCIRVPNDQIVNYDATISDTPDRDAWYVVIAMGLNGKSLAPIYSSTPYADLGVPELVQRLTPIMPPLRALKLPNTPSLAIMRPYALTNPIWIDVGGNGLQSVSPPPSWAPEDTKKDTTSDSPSNHQHNEGEAHDHAHTDTNTNTHSSAPEHNHRIGIGAWRQQAQQNASMADRLRTGNLSLPALQQALDGLRYLGTHRH